MAACSQEGTMSTADCDTAKAGLKKAQDDIEDALRGRNKADGELEDAKQKAKAAETALGEAKQKVTAAESAVGDARTKLSTERDKGDYPGKERNVATLDEEFLSARKSQQSAEVDCETAKTKYDNATLDVEINKNALDRVAEEHRAAMTRESNWAAEVKRVCQD
jgi:predicted  nucleic acid-binding Zn-ribbon protein